VSACGFGADGGEHSRVRRTPAEKPLGFLISCQNTCCFLGLNFFPQCLCKVIIKFSLHCSHPTMLTYEAQCLVLKPLNC
jgi:hypothetical protein